MRGSLLRAARRHHGGPPVRLARFIRDEAEPILAEWETVARSIVPGDTMDVTALRDHAKEMLLVIAEDLEAPQTDRTTRRPEASATPGSSEALRRRRSTVPVAPQAASPSARWWQSSAPWTLAVLLIPHEGYFQAGVFPPRGDEAQLHARGLDTFKTQVADVVVRRLGRFPQIVGRRQDPRREAAAASGD